MVIVPSVLFLISLGVMVFLSRIIVADRTHVETEEILRANERLRTEISERGKAEEALLKRQQALELIYAIETTCSKSPFDADGRIAVAIGTILGLDYAAVGRIKNGIFKAHSWTRNKGLLHNRRTRIEAHPCGVAYREKRTCQFSGDLGARFPGELSFAGEKYGSYLGVPILSTGGTVLGVICAMSFAGKTYSDYEFHLIEIFARYIAHEIDHEAMREELRVAHEMNLLGSITAGVAHEVRNPLNGILAISEALFAGLGDKEEYLPYLGHIKNQVDRLSALMKDLLDLGKPLSSSTFVPVSIDGTIAEAIDSFRQSSRHKNRTVAIETVPSCVPCRVMADAAKLHQVIFNLIENACDHSTDDGRIVLEVVKPETSHVTVRIIDNGSGIAVDHLPRVFEPFFTTRKGGTGLGLSIVRHIVALHGGTITLSNNTPLPGLTAAVRLPSLD